jgi:hypothetical protein
MPSRPTTSTAAKKACYCEECVENGGKDSDGRPKGVQFTLAALAGHKAAVALRKGQRASEQAEYEKQQSQRAMESMQEDIVGLVLTDSGPDLHNQPSKLWTSRAEFQEGLSVPSRVPELPVDELINSLGRMSLFPSSEDTGSPSASDNHQPSPPNPRLLKKYDKREKNNRTVKATQVLESIRAEIRTLFDQLSLKPDFELLQEVETKIGRMRSALERTNRTTWSVVEAKRETSTEIQRLEARVLEWRLLVPPPSQVPLTHPNGMAFRCCTTDLKLKVSLLQIITGTYPLITYLRPLKLQFYWASYAASSWAFHAEAGI